VAVGDFLSSKLLYLCPKFNSLRRVFLKVHSLVLYALLLEKEGEEGFEKVENITNFKAKLLLTLFFTQIPTTLYFVSELGKLG